MSGVLVDREALETRIREELERNWQALPYATPHGLAASLAAALALPAQAADLLTGPRLSDLTEEQQQAAVTRSVQSSTRLSEPQAAADAAGVQEEGLNLLKAAQTALEPYMRVIPGTGEPGVLNEAAQVAQRISAYLAQEGQ